MDTTKQSACPLPDRRPSPIALPVRLTRRSLSIARIFGGFPPAFFTAYHAHIPPSEPTSEYNLRAALYELFHYLNHTLLFGVSRTLPR